MGTHPDQMRVVVGACMCVTQRGQIGWGLLLQQGLHLGFMGGWVGLDLGFMGGWVGLNLGFMGGRA